jgi:hypothetical protein
MVWDALEELEGQAYASFSNLLETVEDRVFILK